MKAKRPDDRPKGIRNNNPGNIELGDPWQGRVPAKQQTDPRFVQFTKPVDGIRAIARVLITYQEKRKANDGSRIDSVLEIIERWAPEEDDNPTTSYARSIAQLIHGVEATDEVLEMHDYNHIKPVVEGIIRFENGLGPLKNENTWYTSDEIDEGLRRAGVVKKSKVVNRETTVSVGAAGVGVAQVADSIQPVLNAMTSADAHVASGSIVRLCFGLGIVAVAGFMAYAHYRKAKIGAA